MSAVATFDIGTNSVLCLVAEDRDGEVVALEDRCTITRLGEGVDATRTLAPSAVERTLRALQDHVAAAARHGAARRAAVGTSALRDARDAGAFLERAGTILGCPVEVISGDREALLTFRGATLGLELPGPWCVLDVGGGSTELVEGDAAPRGSVSLNVGSVRMSERFLHTDPPAPSELAALRAHLAEALGPARPLLRPTLVGVAGTVTTLAAVHDGLTTYSRDRIHGRRLSVEELRALVRRLASMSIEARAALPGMPPGRAYPIVAGSLIVEAILAAADAPALIVSDGGVRFGLAAELLRLPEAC